jgi:16S rRNA (cytosine1402-N4)-methyltransferase
MTTPASSRSSAFDAGHTPVLANEAVSLLAPRRDGLYVDATVGAGGHTRALMAAGAGRVIGIDRDRQALDMARANLAEWADRIELVHGRYEQIAAILSARGIARVDGLLADLGASSMQLEQADRGFSFRRAGPLDMRMDASSGLTLAERLAAVDEGTLADVIWRYGDERRSRRVARSILAARDRSELADTGVLAAVVRRAVGARGWQRVDPATRTFQALRIWVNGEIDGLDPFLAAAWSAVAGGGRLVVIAFHSAEDRVVKTAFRRFAGDESSARLLTRRPVVASAAERDRNPRARSARLRALEKVA